MISQMSTDFWAGYVSGAAGIIVGNPLDIIKVRRQCSSSSPWSAFAFQWRQNPHRFYQVVSNSRNLFIGTTAPIVGSGGLNAILFVTYNRMITLLNSKPVFPSLSHDICVDEENKDNHCTVLWTTFLAGAVAGLATWIISTPTELVKCRAQVLDSPSLKSPISGTILNCPSATGNSCWSITKLILRHEGIRGLYLGGVVTALRDSFGYGFYFWTYDSTSRLFSHFFTANRDSSSDLKVSKVLLCGGTAGVVTWASIFPFDVVKTRVQTQVLNVESLTFPGIQSRTKRSCAIQIMESMYRNEGYQAFFRGLTVCSVRAFVVNAVQWAVYEWILRQLDSVSKTRMLIT